MKKPIEKREEVLLAFLGREISKQQAANLLGCTTRTVESYRSDYRKSGRKGLVDHRHSNNYRLSRRS